ncbi:hypothetical protein [Mucilaginibacter sp.]|uniref:hypothetical protein n=1 Tax=Mucilaginibacter sp. TaxID=1882438 RepID=UPI00263A0B6D|nr:hypothetical protein [Mucilaginibacter sp.]
MKKQTIPNEPDEMPVPKPQPEIMPPNDPKEPQIPQEDPEQIPQELPPDAPKPNKYEPGRTE